jgi:hypothetical protein
MTRRFQQGLYLSVSHVDRVSSCSVARPCPGTWPDHRPADHALRSRRSRQFVCSLKVTLRANLKFRVAYCRAGTLEREQSIVEERTTSPWATQTTSSTVLHHTERLLKHALISTTYTGRTESDSCRPFPLTRTTNQRHPLRPKLMTRLVTATMYLALSRALPGRTQLGTILLFTHDRIILLLPSVQRH